jgi:hypothetical protein
MDKIFVYDCCICLYICMIMCVCLIFQFKTGIKLKWECAKPLIHSNFLQLGKTTENRPVIISAAMHSPSKLRPK